MWIGQNPFPTYYHRTLDLESHFINYRGPTWGYIVLGGQNQQFQVAKSFRNILPGCCQKLCGGFSGSMVIRVRVLEIWGAQFIAGAQPQIWCVFCTWYNFDITDNDGNMVEEATTCGDFSSPSLVASICFQSYNHKNILQRFEIRFIL